MEINNRQKVFKNLNINANFVHDFVCHYDMDIIYTL
jgi:hypothetical protein